MTRINVINPQELSDQWLLAEYRELPRVIKQNISIADAPEKYKLGAGHVKWAKKHAYWTMDKSGQWWWYSEKPFIGGEQWHTEVNSSTGMIDNDVFDIAPADDWTKSLIKVGGK